MSVWKKLSSWPAVYSLQNAVHHANLELATRLVCVANTNPTKKRKNQMAKKASKSAKKSAPKKKTAAKKKK